MFFYNGINFFLQWYKDKPIKITSLSVPIIYKYRYIYYKYKFACFFFVFFAVNSFW